MIPGWVLLIASLAYAALLFAVAWLGDRRHIYPKHVRLRPVVYSLALAVYCSSWTFYGAVGSAARDGPSYLPIYLGPVLLFVLFMPFFERLVRVAKQHNVTSIADLVASRFGKSNRLAVVITLIALTAAVPYVALQLKAVAMSVEVMTGASREGLAGPWAADSALWVAAAMALFAMLFGTRAIDAAEHHPGLVLAVAVESLVKLVAFVAVGLFAVAAFGDLGSLAAGVRALPVAGDNFASFVTQTLIALTAIFCLPRQFQVGVVECAEPADLRHARWMFPAYLAVISVFVLPIAALGLAGSGGTAVNPDTFVLRLPLAAGHEWLAMLAYIGGFSAATGMVIVVCVALATMISNDLLLPLIWRLRARRGELAAHSTRLVLWTRRAAIVLLLALAFAYYRGVPSAPSLASIGLLAFAAVAQFAPALLASLYWPRASRAGVMAGLLVGYGLWLYTLLLPGLLAIEGAPPSWVTEGPAGLGLLAPQALFGLVPPDPLTHGVFWSLFANVLVLVAVSRLRRPSLDEQLRASAFLEPEAAAAGLRGAPIPGGATAGDLMTLAEHVLGPRSAARLMAEHARETGRALAPGDPADVGLLRRVEHDIAGAIGAASARLMLTSTLRGAGLKLGQVVALLDETSAQLRLSRGLLEAMMDNMAQAISVVDRELKLVAWNRRYEEMFRYPPGLLYAGRPVEDVIRFNAGRGWCGRGEVEDLVRRRMAHLAARNPHVSSRELPDGLVIELRTQPLDDGGLVTTFTDVTDYKRVESELRLAAETLEERVLERTEQLRQAKLEAEQANQGKTRFVAAASHDLLQPMNAARLFLSALRSRDLRDPEAKSLAERVDTSLRAAEELLDALLDVTKLDSGGVTPQPVDFPAAQLLDSLAEQFAPLAADRRLSLKVMPTRLAVRSDPRMLKRVLQNFLGNALRYTRRGGVVIGCRRRGAEVEFQVWDTGPGVPADALTEIFEEFRRLDQPSPWGEKGLGLGLSICDRISRLLDAPLVVRSRPGRGSLFAIRVPRSTAAIRPRGEGPQRTRAAALAGMTVLCLDDEPDILAGMAALLGRWGVRVLAARSAGEAHALVASMRPDAVLADYHLRGEQTGLEVLAELCARAGGCPGALITANASEALAQQARERGYALLRKPVKPAALRALLGSFPRPRPAAAVQAGASS
jgi:Na+/proline symporter/signal transduction histidine kinase/CheY-like chemotaxis protein